MPITVNHNAPIAPQGEMALAIGQGRFNQDRDRLLLQQQALNRDFSERQRQFDINTQLQIEQQQAQEDRYYQQMAAQTAGQQQALEAGLMGRAMDNQAQLMGQQMQQNHQAGMAGQQWAMQGSVAVDAQITEAMNAARQIKYDPEGQRLFNELAGKVRSAQAQRSVLRPEQYAMLQQKILADIERANLGSYEIKEPTAEEKFRKALTREDGIPVRAAGQPLLPGSYRLEGMRNGIPTYEWMWVDDPNLTPQQNFEAQLRKTPDGTYVIRDKDGGFKEFKAPSGGPSMVEDEMKQKEHDLKIQEHENKQWENDISLGIKLTTPDEFGNKPNIDEAMKAAAKVNAARHQELQRQGPPGAAQTPFAHPNSQGAPPTPPKPGEKPAAKPPVQIKDRTEADALQVGDTFIFNGVTFRKTGPGQAEPI